MVQLVNTIFVVVLIVLGTAVVFVGLNKALDLLPARMSEKLRPIVFVGPAFLFLTITLIGPTIRTIYLSFFDRRGEESVGFDNYGDTLGNRTIFNADGIADMFTSRLFIIGAIVAIVALVLVIARGTTSGTGVDLSAPVPVFSLTTAGILIMLAVMSVVRGVIWNNFFWIVLVTGLSTIIGLAIAVLADRSRGESIAKSLIFMPMAISFVGASVIWGFVYAFRPAGSDQIGLLNATWDVAGGDPRLWLQEPPWNNLLLIFIMIWIQTGFAMVVLSAAIKGVPTDTLEAATVDGANELQTFWRVTVPQIRSTIAVVVTTLVITVLKVFDIVKVMTGGTSDTDVVANRMFDEVFVNNQNGRGSALAVMLLAVVFPLMVVNVRRLRRAE